MKIVNSDQMKQLDRMVIEQFGIPGVILMEHAGSVVLEEVLKYIEQKENKEVVIVCGLGNNGGDGFVVARQLFNKGIPLKVVIIGNPSDIGGDAKINYDIIHKLKVDIHILIGANNMKKFADAIKGCGIIVDAIFGTGLKREVDGYIQEIINIINGSGKQVIAIDIPSGIGANDGKVYGMAVKANKTVVLELPKICNIHYPGIEYIGEMIIKSIGMPKAVFENIRLNINLITKDMVKEVLPFRKKDSYKGNYGKAYVVAGSTGMTGASILTCEATLRSGAGLLKIPVPQSLNTIMETRLIEAITVPLPEFKKGVVGISDIEKIIKTMEESDVITVGPGSGNSRELEELLRNILEHTSKPIVLDADALNSLAKRKELLELITSQTVMTPHVGEMSRLTDLEIDYIKENRIEVATEFSRKWNTVVVLKGSRTVVAGPNGDIYINETGNPGMATAGSGDVLTGIVTGFIAQGIDPLKAAMAAVYVHGMAGDLVAEKLGEYGLMASDIVKQLPFAIKEIIGK
ncbi:NAD(P)H-hydrate dehydratase [Marinisporobacter balticus]|uniref:Bifunctional NAD(P)H-hydrate repair enzyme n=1 Tax=Marinisporobacter balticus TaxID=2018667 RepID=A0A4R2KSM4_9FIRM|nr:NAD(P)H-hydrate dehydratase [Marinisporobacter balticus]TCO73158.1 NAD(P)H-hydrate epimerase [Marinisporobacter balticus]